VRRPGNNSGKLSAMSLIVLLQGAIMIGCQTLDAPVAVTQPVKTPHTTVQPAVNLRSTSGFVILAGSVISNVPTSVVIGNVGLSPAVRSFITGFRGTEITGRVYAADDVLPDSVPSMLVTAKDDLTSAYNDAAGRTAADIVKLSGDIGGKTLTPGLYKSSDTLEISSGDITFDARGDSTAVFIIQIASALITSADRQTLLIGAARASNIFWQVGTSVTLGAASVFNGTIMADQSISLNSSARVEGRLFARNGGVTLEYNTVMLPAP